MKSNNLQINQLMIHYACQETFRAINENYKTFQKLPYKKKRSRETSHIKNKKLKNLTCY
jgi:hypothetical protein